LIDPAVRAEAVAAAERLHAVGGFGTPLRRKDGELRQVEFSPQLLAGDELLLSIARDIIDRAG
jgi:hypothetical protein